MQSTPRDNSSLRQRRSRSPVKNRHADPEDTIPLIATVGSFSKPTNGEVSASKGKGSTMPTSWMIILGAVGLIFLVLLSLLLLWLALLTGVYNPDSDCPVPTFDYPDCSHSFMHEGEVAPPLTFDEWLDLRERFHHALSIGGKGAPSSLADDWREPNTYGFVDLTMVEFRYSPGRGRAVFASRPIDKGTKIWDSRYRAVFPNGCVARIFFANQTNQQKCDAMFWGYDNNFYGNGIQYMFDLDGHGYINHHDEHPNAMHHFEGELEKNRYALSRFRIPFLGIYPLSTEDWERRNRPGAYGLYAARDIAEGEEILYNYDEIYMLGGWDWFTIFLENSLPIWEWNTL